MRSGAINLGNPVSSSPLNRGLVGWWLALPQRMGGNRLMDLCQPGNHGTLTNGPTWQSVAGRPGGFGSVLYDGTNDYAAVGTVAALAPADEQLSASCWCKMAGSPATNDSIFGFVGANWFTSWGFRWNSSTVLDFFYGSYLTDFGRSGTLSPTEWNHFLGTSNGTTATIYVNGVAAATTGTVTTSGAISAANTLDIGRNTNDSFNVNAYLDDVRIWLRCLTADNVLAVYNDSRTGYPQTLNRLPMRAYGTAGGGGGNRRRRVICSGGY